MTRLLTDPTFPSMSFSITNCLTCPIVAGDFLLTLWGIDMPNVAGTDVSFQMFLLSASLNTIDQSTVAKLLQYDNTATPVEMKFENLNLAMRNKRTRGEISFDFSTNNRYIS